MKKWTAANSRKNEDKQTSKDDNIGVCWDIPKKPKGQSPKLLYLVYRYVNNGMFLLKEKAR